MTFSQNQKVKEKKRKEKKVNFDQHLNPWAAAAAKK